MFGIEIILLGATLIIIMTSVQQNDIQGAAFGLLAICSAGAESVVGLGLLVSFYRLRGDLGQGT
jgi:NADH-ubiquinone oxidoreductase chain 4L